MPPARKWGGVARRGAGKVTPEEPGRRQGRPPRKRGQPPKKKGAPELGPPPAWEPEEWIEEPDTRPVRAQAEKAVARAGGPPRRTRKAPTDVVGEIAAAVGPKRAARAEQHLMEAARAFERERYKDADKQLKTLVEWAPEVPAARELWGLTLYRLGRWDAAARQLEAYRQQTGSVTQHPVLADCYRALGRHRKADKLWDELRQADAPADVVTEGRIVAAGSRADRGDIAAGIRLLEKGPVRVKRPKAHHLRLWYALADLYERAGDTPRARDLFSRITAASPDFADAAERVSSLN